jgi:hypothetical protein
MAQAEKIKKMIDEFRKYHNVIPDPVEPVEESNQTPVASAQESQAELTDKSIENDAEEVLL